MEMGKTHVVEGEGARKEGGKKKKNPNMGSSVIINRIVFTLSREKMFVRPNKVDTPAKMYILFADLGICHLSPCNLLFVRPNKVQKSDPRNLPLISNVVLVRILFY